MLTDFETALLAHRTAEATRGDANAAYDLGVAYSTGTCGAALDLTTAHKWFNLAAVGGHEDAAAARAEIAEDMTAREIATAQRVARDLLSSWTRRAA
ncbi:hypothetical protein ACMGDM_15530 [Sphingomonas sp. DT-51]|uniref:hypothetical protein n=1 Tax=Sphingomonas sp. DT-51 TaxID=3396165 RepID=UPI003F1B3813